MRERTMRGMGARAFGTLWCGFIFLSFQKRKGRRVRRAKIVVLLHEVSLELRCFQVSVH